MKDIILFIDLVNPNYLPLIQTVAKSEFTLVMNNNPLTQAVQRAGVSFIPWESFMPSNTRMHIHQKITQITKALPNAFEQQDVLQAFSSPMGNFLPQTGHQFFEQLTKLVANEIAVLDTLEALVQQQNVRLIVFGYDNNHVQRALARYATQKQIPTLHLPHGMLAKSRARIAGEMHALYAQHLAAFGERTRRIMIEQGNDPARIMVTGAPTWDILYKPEARIDKSEARRQLGLNPDKPVIVYCTRYTDGSSAFYSTITKRLVEVHRIVAQAVGKISSDIQFVIRPHPRELTRIDPDLEKDPWLNKAYFHWLAQQGVQNAYLFRDRKVETIRAADVVVVAGGSAVIPEVMILQRPVVQVAIYDQATTTYTAQDGIVVIDEDDQLSAVLTDLLAQSERRAEIVQRQNCALLDINFENDGRATERVANLIQQLAVPTKQQTMTTSANIDASFLAEAKTTPDFWGRLDPLFSQYRRYLYTDPGWRYGPRRIHEVAYQAYTAFTQHTTILGKTYLDLGAGMHHPFGNSAVMYLNGAKATIALDVQPADPARAAEALYDLLSDCLVSPDDWHWSELSREEFLARIRHFNLRALQQGDLATGLEGLPLRYYLSDINEHTILPSSVDLVSSRAVLEHFLDFETAVTHLYKIQAPGAVAYHSIDMSDHRHYQQPDRFHMWSFLAEDDSWTDGLCNRLRYSEIKTHFEQAGFVIAHCDSDRQPLPPGFKKQLKGRFSSMSTEDLETISMRIVVKKPHPAFTQSKSTSPRKVLFAYRNDVDLEGGAALVMKNTAAALGKFGVQVDFTYEIEPDVKGYDLVHVFNIWKPDTALRQLQYLRRTGIAIVWLPFYLNWTEYIWARLSIPALYDLERSEEERRHLFQTFVQGTLTVNGMTRWQPNEVYPGFHQQLHQMLDYVDHICLTSYREAQLLAQITGLTTKPFTITRHGVDADLLRTASPEAFVNRFGFKDFVLSVGAIDGRKNQLMLIEALKGTDLKLVLIGPSFEPDYLDLCRREGGDQVLMTGRLPRELVASAYKAAAVHALPSFAEGSALANLEAAVAGCPIVTSNRSSEFEYFGDAPYYCDPTNPASIREAILQAYTARSTESERWQSLSDYVQETYTWQQAAQETLKVYRQVLARTGEKRETENHQPVTIATDTPLSFDSSPADSNIPSPSILWRAPIFDFSGYAFLSRQTILALDNQQVRLQADSFTLHPKFEEQFKINRAEFDIWHRLSNTRVDSGLHICVHPPVVWNGTDIFDAYRQKSPNSKAHVGVTMFETDRLPSGWASACNNMDEIWVPSTFNRETFAKAGVDPHRLQVIPFGLDTAIYDPDKVAALNIPDAKGFVFLSVFQWNKRKGWDVLLKAYLSAFTAKDDVCLVLRTYPDQQKTPPIRQRVKRYIRKLGYKPGTTPPIILLDDFVPENQMPALYAAADAFVLPTRGEGWGIPFMEAMAMALPVIGTRWSAHLDFMNDDNSYLIDIEGLRPIDREQTQENLYYQPDHQWAEPSVGHTAELMRQVYENRDETRTKGRQARRDIQTNWSLNRTVEWIIERSTHLSQPTDKQTNPRTAERSPLTNNPSLPLLWHAPIFDPSGYADEARNFILQLHTQGFDIAANAIGRHSETFRSQLDPHKQQILELVLAQQPPAKFINLIHFPAYIFQRLPQAAYNIGRVMFETDGLPAEWVAKCNQMDEIWVPTDFNIQTFKDGGVTVKLVKVPGGIDTDQFQPGYDPLLIPGVRGTVFLSVFEWIYRKGWDVLLRAWSEAFAPADDVCLVLRTYPINATDVPDTKGVIEDHINRFLQTELNLSRDEVAPIIVLAEQIPEEDLPRLYAAATAYVAPSRGEGWGRPHMQAMACGLPVIATNWGGNLEFMNKQNSLLIDIEGLTEIDERAEIPFYRGQRWAEPSVAHLVSHLQYVHRHPTEAAAIGQQAHRDMLEHWQWHKAANMAIERLHTIQMELSPIGQVPNLAPTAPPATNGSQPHPEERQIASEKSINLRWEGSQFVHHSLALINREFCLRLAQDQPIDLSIIPYEPDQFDSHIDPRFEHITRNLNRSLARPADVHVRHQWPPNFTPPAEGRWVMIQPWEFGSIPKHWIEIMREKVDEVWAYTNYVRDCYIRSGLPAHKVHVVPPGVDTAKFHPDAPPLALKTKKRFKFLFVGGTIARKGIDILLDAYVSSFTANDDVCLVIKDMGGRSFYKGQTAQETIAQIQADPNAPEIEYIDRILDDTQLAGLYTAGTCLVHPYRGEGFGLPIAEAMACGLPVIVTGHGAALDFCSLETAYLIPAREVRLPEKRIGDNETVDYPWWADPDRSELSRLMRHVAANPVEAATKGRAATAYIQANFTWEHAVAKVRQRLEVLCRPQEELPMNPTTLPNPLAQVRAAQSVGNWQQAVDLLKDALAESAPLWNQLGYCYFQAGQLVEAEAAFNTGLELAPESLDILNNLAELYLQQEQFDQATEYLNRALQINPNDVNVLLSLGNCCIQLNVFDTALMAFQRVQALAPETEGISEVINQLELMEVEALEAVL